MHENIVIDKQGSYRERQQSGMGEKPSKRSKKPPLNKKWGIEEGSLSGIRQEDRILGN